MSFICSICGQVHKDGTEICPVMQQIITKDDVECTDISQDQDKETIQEGGVHVIPYYYTICEVCGEHNSIENERCSKCGSFLDGDPVATNNPGIKSDKQSVLHLVSSDGEINLAMNTDEIRFCLDDKTELGAYLRTRKEKNDNGILVTYISGQGYRHGCHARMKRNNFEWFILEDNPTANGTYINGEKMIPQKTYRISRGDTIGLGSKEYGASKMAAYFLIED